jgi:hypothetical protein
VNVYVGCFVVCVCLSEVVKWNFSTSEPPRHMSTGKDEKKVCIIFIIHLMTYLMKIECNTDRLKRCSVFNGPKSSS